MDNDSIEPIVVTENNKKNINRKVQKFYLYVLYFFLFSFIGWLLETFYSLYELGHFTKRGFLYGPLCPIYGWGALILIIFFRQYKNKNFKLFIYAAVIFSIFEYSVGYAMDALFSAKWWDYSTEFFNLNGRISIFYSFVWGIIAILFTNIIFPFLKKKVNYIITKIPYKVQTMILNLLIIIFFTDTFMSFIRYLG